MSYGIFLIDSTILLEMFAKIDCYCIAHFPLPMHLLYSTFPAADALMVGPYRKSGDVLSGRCHLTGTSEPCRNNLGSGLVPRRICTTQE
jgi:hypothetical protein